MKYFKIKQYSQIGIACSVFAYCTYASADVIRITNNTNDHVYCVLFNKLQADFNDLDKFAFPQNSQKQYEFECSYKNICSFICAPLEDIPVDARTLLNSPSKITL